MPKKKVRGYDEADLKHLDDISHIQLNAGLYIGVTENPNHLLYEVVDNALDEAQSGNATRITTSIDTKKGVVSISDNGRGIPFKNESVPMLVTNLKAGGKFNKGESNAYGISSGLHGIGLAAVDALSTWISVEVYRDKKYVYYMFRGDKVVDHSIKSYTGRRPFATKITFCPNKKFFESVNFDLPAIRDRLRLASSHIEDLTLMYIVDGKEEKINCDFQQYFSEELKLDGNEYIELINTVKDEEVRVFVFWDFNGSNSSKSIGSVNLLKVNYGTHIFKTHNLIKDAIEKLAKKNKLNNFIRNDSIVCLRTFTSMMLYEPKYSSQTKDKLAIPRTGLDHLFNGLDVDLVECLSDPDNSEIRTNLLRFLSEYRKSQDASKHIIKSEGRINRFNTSTKSRLTDCKSKNIEKTELYIVEGRSAEGTLRDCRDREHHAILPIRGKILNVVGDKKDPFKNDEIIDLINSLGTGVEPDFTLKSLRYGKIIFATDADPDGAHIAALLIVAFLKLVPKLFDEGRVYKSVLPLHAAISKKEFIPLYSEEELTKFRTKNPKGYTFQRFKGLGEMNSSQLKVCLIDKDTRKLIQIKPSKNKDYIFRLMQDPEAKRQIL